MRELEKKRSIEFDFKISHKFMNERLVVLSASYCKIKGIFRKYNINLGEEND